LLITLPTTVNPLLASKITRHPKCPENTLPVTVSPYVVGVFVGAGEDKTAVRPDFLPINVFPSIVVFNAAQLSSG
jgi:hypothetical protein